MTPFYPQMRGIVLTLGKRNLHPVGRYIVLLYHVEQERRRNWGLLKDFSEEKVLPTHSVNIRRRYAKKMVATTRTKLTTQFRLHRREFTFSSSVHGLSGWFDISSNS